jgi:hypothetical protein
MSDAGEFLKRLGEELMPLLGDGFKFYRSKLELRQSRDAGRNVIILSGSNKASPHISVSFYFGRNFDGVRQLERKYGEYPMPQHIQQYSPNLELIEGMEYGGPHSWDVDIRSPPSTLAAELHVALQGMAFPFFRRFADIEVARDALASDDSWCFSIWTQLFMVDAALGDLAHFRRWMTCLDPFTTEQAVEKLQQYTSEV